jgi:hypothetical protein
MPKDTMGTYTPLDLKSVKNSTSKTVTYLKNAVPKVHRRSCTVIFLGEMHTCAVDLAVTREILTTPPITSPGRTRAIFERPLQALYITGVGIDHEEEEPNLPITTRARSAVIGDLILRAFDPNLANDDVVYVICGAAHGVEIFNYINKRMTQQFTFISKLSDTDY